MAPESVLFKIVEGSLLVLFAAVVAVVIVFACRKVWRGRNTAANAWMLPFARFSIGAWILWILQHGILVAGSFGLLSNESLRSASLLPAILKSILWIVAISSLHAKLFSRVSLTLPPLALISIGVALVVYQFPTLTSDPLVHMIGAASVATIFTLLAASIWSIRLNRLYPIVFCLHGFSTVVWYYMFSKPSISIQMSVIVFSFWHAVVAFTWLLLVSEMLVRFRVMIASTIRDLGPERAAAGRAIRDLNLQGLRSETIGSRPYNPESLCKLWAEQCNVFILIIGGSYGHRITSTGKSVVEFEFEVAREKDPGKILVYVKDGVTREPKLQEFLDRLQDFKDGYVLDSPFHTPEELETKVRRDVQRWLDGRDDWY